jgi:hypothetical protein
MKKAEEVQKEISGAEQAVANARREIGTILMSHITKKPWAVMIVTMGEYGFATHCAGFNEAGPLLLAEKLVKKVTHETFETFMTRSRMEQAESSNPPAPTPENPT